MSSSFSYLLEGDGDVALAAVEPVLVLGHEDTVAAHLAGLTSASDFLSAVNFIYLQHGQLLLLVDVMLLFGCGELLLLLLAPFQRLLDFQGAARHDAVVSESQFTSQRPASEAQGGFLQVCKQRCHGSAGHHL